MAARTLINEQYVVAAAATWHALGTAVAAGRARVGRLVVTNANSGNPITFLIGVGSAASSSLAAYVVLGPGESWEQAGVVILTGQRIQAHCVNAANNMQVVFMGEEVDN